MTYTIADKFLENLEKKMNRIQKKCDALGLPFTYKVGDATVIRHVEIIDGVAFEQFFPAHEVEVEGIAKINGWTFVAKIEHTETGNLLLCAPDMTCPETYRDAEPICEHCHTKKNRKETFVIVNENGEYKQVGKSCLMLYTNGLNAEACAEYASIAHMLEEYHNNCSGCEEEVFGAELFVAVCYEYILKNGYDRDKLEVYADRSFHWNEGYKGVVTYCKACLEKYSKEAKEIVEKGRNMTKVTDYLMNVKVVLSGDYVPMRRLGLIASFVNICIKDRAKADKQAEDAKVSAHVGNIGERIEIRIPVINGMAYRVLYTKSYEVAWRTYSEVDVVEIRDADGNIYKWNASNLATIDQAVANGAKEIVLKATVKSHDEYKGVKQTVITRCALK